METVSFEEIVKRVCGDSWQDWLGVYEAGITAGVQNAVAVSKRALAEVESVKAYAVESEATSYIWAKFEAVPTGGGGFEWATDSVHTELSDPPMPVCLFRDLSYADLGPGFKPNIALNMPYIVDGETNVKPIPAVTQSKVWKEYPYFWEGGAAIGTDVLRYDDMQRVVVNVGGTASEKYRYRVSRLMHVPVTYEPGAYIGTITANNATAYPRDGYKGGYYYMRFAAMAEDVSFNCPDLSAKNVRDAIIEVARMGGNGSGTAMSVIEVEELPATGIKGVFYIVKKPGDTDASEYLWLDRWEKVGGTGSAHIQSYIASDDPPEDVRALWVNTSKQDESVALGVTAEETAEGVDLYCTDELGTTKGTVRNGRDGAPGKTPVKGEDYFLPDEIEEIAEKAAELAKVSVRETALLDTSVEIPSDAPVRVVELEIPEAVKQFDDFYVEIKSSAPTNSPDSDISVRVTLCGNNLAGSSNGNGKFRKANQTWVTVRVDLLRRSVINAVYNNEPAYNYSSSMTIWSPQDILSVSERSNVFKAQFTTEYAGTLTVKIFGYG
jgi:hypothetical protein